MRGHDLPKCGQNLPILASPAAQRPHARVEPPHSIDGRKGTTRYPDSIRQEPGSVVSEHFSAGLLGASAGKTYPPGTPPQRSSAGKTSPERHPSAVSGHQSRIPHGHELSSTPKNTFIFKWLDEVRAKPTHPRAKPPHRPSSDPLADEKSALRFSSNTLRGRSRFRSAEKTYRSAGKTSPSADKTPPMMPKRESDISTLSGRSSRNSRRACRPTTSERRDDDEDNLAGKRKRPPRWRGAGVCRSVKGRFQPICIRKLPQNRERAQALSVIPEAYVCTSARWPIKTRPTRRSAKG